MVTWAEFSAVAPGLAGEIKEMIYQYGPGLGYLATVRADGGPRVHPVCPVITNEALYCFLVATSPKRADLDRDGRYALHTFAAEDTDDEAYLTGTADKVADRAKRAAAIAAYHIPVPDDHLLYEFSVERAMLARYRHRGDWPPRYTTWNARR